MSRPSLSVPDIDSYVGLMHTLFTLEDNYGLKISEMDGEVCLKVDVRKNRTPPSCTGYLFLAAGRCHAGRQAKSPKGLR